ncbi:MAG: chorismate-binding protein, partial [Pseudomonadales bacterium]|nr:chorismate-binding protein [Pseudomonadales bacterium]
MPTYTTVSSLPYYDDSTEYVDRLTGLPQIVYFDSGIAADSTRPPQNTKIETNNKRFDIISAAPLFSLRFDETGFALGKHCTPVSKTSSALLEALERAMAESPSIPALFDQLGAFIRSEPDTASLPFTGGFIGYLAYDLGSALETLPQQALKDIDIPDLHLGFYSWACIVDHALRTTQLVTLNEEAEGLHSEIKRRLSTKNTQINNEKFFINKALEPEINVERYKDKHAEIQHLIFSGDCYQVNFTQRFSGSYSGSEWLAYKQLRKVMPGPFSAFYQPEKQFAILSFSPERFIAVRHNTVLTQPIKGTSPRSAHPAIDRANAESLQRSEKNRAENIMIVDLLRNDLGKSCIPGSIQV